VHHAARILVATGVLLSAACVGQRPSDAAPHNPNLLTRAELATYTTADLAVQTLRPAWLRQRSAGGFLSSGQVWVYRDGMRFGGVATLRSINTVEIESIQYVDGIAASQRWGLGHENGVIHVISRLH
jgi:hypothetical protein